MCKVTICLAFLMVLTLNVPVEAQPWDGSGTEGEPYRIEDANDMNEIGTYSEYWGSHFLLVNDIDLAGYTGSQFNIIGNSTNPFVGIFNGNFHTISNLQIETTEIDYVALFGYVKNLDAEIKNIVLIDPNVLAYSRNNVSCLIAKLENGKVSDCQVINGNVSGYQRTGLLVGENTGEIKNCNVSGKITGGGYLGGLAGDNSGTIINCQSDVEISASRWNYFYIGALVGYNYSGGSITDCNSFGSIITICENVGGLVGGNQALIHNCIANVTINGGDENIGGLVGLNFNGNISFCHAYGAVVGGLNTDHVGGLVGRNSNGIITNCLATGAVGGGGFNANRIGGLVGDNYQGTLLQSKATGQVSGEANQMGGLVGYNSGGDISRCYAKGSVQGSASSDDIGGLVGMNYYISDIDNCFATGHVSGRFNIGGLIGQSKGKNQVDDCYAQGNVVGSGKVGGLVGNSIYYLGGTYFLRCYSIGSVPGSGSGIGGLSGSGGYFTDSFWDIDASGCNISNGGIGQTTSQMKQNITFTNWDFAETWGIEDEQTYPFLRLSYPVGDINLDRDVNLIDFAYLAAYWLESTEY